MHRSLSLLVALPALISLAACERSSPAAPATVHPAEVHGARPETELSTITLTEQAIERLGIETVAVERRFVRQTRTLGGELIVPPGRSVTVTAPVAGSLAEPGDGVVPATGTLLRRAQEVLRLHPIGPAGNDLVQREAEARARYEAAGSRARRAEQLLRDRAGSQRQVEEAQAELAIADATLQGVEQQRRAIGGGADGDLGAWSIQAPLSGRLGQSYVAAGQTVTPSTPLFDVFADDPLWVRVPVYVGDLSSLDRDAHVTVQDIGTKASWSSAIEQVSSARSNVLPTRNATPLSAPRSADSRAATVDLFYRLDNPDRAYQPFQRVAVTIPMASTDSPGGDDESLVVPYAAVLVDIHGGTWVYENTAPRQYVRRRVEIRRVVGDQAVLSRGPAPSTLVVSVGGAELFGTEFGVGH